MTVPPLRQRQAARRQPGRARSWARPRAGAAAHSREPGRARPVVVGPGSTSASGDRKTALAPAAPPPACTPPRDRPRRGAPRAGCFVDLSDPGCRATRAPPSPGPLRTARAALARETRDRPLPDVGRVSVPTIESSVDFPEPLGPWIVVSDPGANSHETPTSARTGPYIFVTFRTSMPPIHSDRRRITGESPSATHARRALARSSIVRAPLSPARRRSARAVPRRGLVSPVLPWNV